MCVRLTVRQDCYSNKNKIGHETHTHTHTHTNTFSSGCVLFTYSVVSSEGGGGGGGGGGGIMHKT